MKNTNVTLTDLPLTETAADEVKGGWLFGLFGVAAGAAVGAAGAYVVYETLGGGSSGTALNNALGGNGVVAREDGSGCTDPLPSSYPRR